MSTDAVRITFLGGLGEIGRNCACIELGDRAVLLDCGLEFPDETTPGVEQVVPDLSYLRTHAGRLEAMIATHGHEDHIGAIPELLAEFDVPIYGSPVTLGLIRNRLEPMGLLGRTELRPVGDNERHQVGPFEVEFLPITHSVPHGFASAIHTPAGVILHSGDFKLDLAPVDGRTTDLSRIGALADGKGITLLLSDSTNAESEGWSVSETVIGARLAELIAERPERRVIVGTFASHIHRVMQIVRAGLDAGRTIVPLGRSMQRNLRLARDLGLLSVPDDRVADIEEIEQFEPGEVLVVCTGSQAEPMSALSLIASGESKWVEVGGRDTVILSSTPIPGNERRITQVINSLVDAGAEVIHSGIAEVHTTGHGKADELRTLLAVAQPRWFTPVHGEARHLERHAELAVGMGMDPRRVLRCRDGDQLLVRPDEVEIVGHVDARPIWRHGLVYDVDQRLLDDRTLLGNEGFVAIVVVVDMAGRRLVAEPRVESRGWVGTRSVGSLLPELEARVASAVTEALVDRDVDLPTIERRVRRVAGSWVNERTRRRPPIIPVVLAI